MTLILQIEPILEQNWGKSLAHLLPPPVWDTLRREVYKDARYACCFCHAIDVKLHAHELWAYDDKKHIQKLRGFQCVCEDCHAIKHWGRTVRVTQHGELPSNTIARLTLHFCKVNNCTPLDFENHKYVVGNIAHRRSKFKYKVDFGKFEPNKVVEIWNNKKGKV